MTDQGDESNRGGASSQRPPAATLIDPVNPEELKALRAARAAMKAAARDGATTLDVHPPSSASEDAGGAPANKAKAAPALPAFVAPIDLDSIDVGPHPSLTAEPEATPKDAAADAAPKTSEPAPSESSEAPALAGPVWGSAEHKAKFGGQTAAPAPSGPTGMASQDTAGAEALLSPSIARAVPPSARPERGAAEAPDEDGLAPAPSDHSPEDADGGDSARPAASSADALGATLLRSDHPVERPDFGARTLVWMERGSAADAPSGSESAPERGGAWGARKSTLLVALVAVFLVLGGLAWAMRPVVRGTVVIRTEPPGARIYIDGHSNEHRTPVRAQLEVGPHVFALSRADFEDERVEVRVEANQTVERFVRMVPVSPPGTKTVTVKVRPIPAEIRWDGKPMGTHSVLHIAGVSPDEPHRLEARAPGFRRISRRIAKGTLRKLYDLRLDRK